MTAPTHDTLTNSLIPLALAAGALIMDIYARGFDVKVKPDDSPVTEADMVAERLIVQGLKTAFPDIPIVAEEMCAAGAQPKAGPLFFLVDALDGTKEFVARRSEFTVNIALIADGQPYFGIVYAPASNSLYVTVGPDAARYADVSPRALTEMEGLELSDIAVLKPINVRAWPDTKPVALASRSHKDERTDAFLKLNGIEDRMSFGSSLKFCQLAAGAADIYPRFGPTMEWDTAAGHAVLSAAGGAVVTPHGAPFHYGKTDLDFKNGAFIAASVSGLNQLQFETEG